MAANDRARGLHLIFNSIPTDVSTSPTVSLTSTTDTTTDIIEINNFDEGLF